MAEVLFRARLQRTAADTPWGFRLQGGAEYDSPLTLLKVVPDSVADKGGLQDGDIVVRLGGQSADNMLHKDAQQAIMMAGDSLEIIVERAEVTITSPITALPSDNDTDFTSSDCTPSDTIPDNELSDSTHHHVENEPCDDDRQDNIEEEKLRSPVSSMQENLNVLVTEENLQPPVSSPESDAVTFQNVSRVEKTPEKSASSIQESDEVSICNVSPVEKTPEKSASSIQESDAVSQCHVSHVEEKIESSASLIEENDTVSHCHVSAVEPESPNIDCTAPKTATHHHIPETKSDTDIKLHTQESMPDENTREELSNKASISQEGVLPPSTDTCYCDQNLESERKRVETTTLSEPELCKDTYIKTDDSANQVEIIDHDKIVQKDHTEDEEAIPQNRERPDTDTGQIDFSANDLLRDKSSLTVVYVDPDDNIESRETKSIVISERDSSRITNVFLNARDVAVDNVDSSNPLESEVDTISVIEAAIVNSTKCSEGKPVDVNSGAKKDIDYKTKEFASKSIVDAVNEAAKRDVLRSQEASAKSSKVENEIEENIHPWRKPRSEKTKVAISTPENIQRSDTVDVMGLSSHGDTMSTSRPVRSEPNIVKTLPVQPPHTMQIDPSSVKPKSVSGAPPSVANSDHITVKPDLDTQPCLTFIGSRVEPSSVEIPIHVEHTRSVTSSNFSEGLVYLVPSSGKGNSGNSDQQEYVEQFPRTEDIIFTTSDLEGIPMPAVKEMVADLNRRLEVIAEQHPKIAQTAEFGLAFNRKFDDKKYQFKMEFDPAQKEIDTRQLRGSLELINQRLLDKPINNFKKVYDVAAPPRSPSFYAEGARDGRSHREPKRVTFADPLESSVIEIESRSQRTRTKTREVTNEPRSESPSTLSKKLDRIELENALAASSMRVPIQYSQQKIQKEYFSPHPVQTDTRGFTRQDMLSDDVVRVPRTPSDGVTLPPSANPYGGFSVSLSQPKEGQIRFTLKSDNNRDGNPPMRFALSVPAQSRLYSTSTGGNQSPGRPDSTSINYTSGDHSRGRQMVSDNMHSQRSSYEGNNMHSQHSSYDGRNNVPVRETYPLPPKQQHHIPVQHHYAMSDPGRVVPVNSPPPPVPLGAFSPSSGPPPYSSLVNMAQTTVTSQFSHQPPRTHSPRPHHHPGTSHMSLTAQPQPTPRPQVIPPQGPHHVLTRQHEFAPSTAGGVTAGDHLHRMPTLHNPVQPAESMTGFPGPQPQPMQEGLFALFDKNFTDKFLQWEGSQNEPTQSATYKLVQEMDEDEKRYGSS